MTDKDKVKDLLKELKIIDEEYYNKITIYGFNTTRSERHNAVPEHKSVLDIDIRLHADIKE